MASFVVEDVKEFCKSFSPNHAAWAYYYCYFRREQDETSHLLRWVIKQVCQQRNYIPDEVLHLYDDGGEPTIASLILALSAAIRGFHHVFLVIDALDESFDRQNLLDVLVEIARDDIFEKLRLLVMSRKEVDIEASLEGICKDISLSNEWVDKDIQLHISNQLRIHREFNRWSRALKEEIEGALIKGAKGMYASTTHLVKSEIPRFTDNI